MSEKQNTTEEAPEPTAYRMKTNGGTVGAVSGKGRIWSLGQIIVAPEGEFAHLPATDYEEVSMETSADDTETATAPEAPETATAKPQRKSRKSRKS